MFYSKEIGGLPKHCFLYSFKLLNHKNRGVQTIFVYEPSGSSQGQVPIFCINLAQFRLGLLFLSGSITKGMRPPVFFFTKLPGRIIAVLVFDRIRKIPLHLVAILLDTLFSFFYV
jgi:hypothetical protein